MIKSLFSFGALFSAVLLLTVGNGLLVTLLSIRMASAGVSAQMTGLVMSMFYAGLVAGSFFAPLLVRRIGHIRSFAVFAAMATVCALIHAMTFHPMLWVCLRLMAGIAVTGNYMIVESWLNACIEPGMRGRVFATYMVLNYTGYGIGQLLLGANDIQSPTPFLIAGILLCLCLIPVSATRSVRPHVPATIRFDIIRLFRLAPFSMFGCMVSGMISGSFYTLAPVFGVQTGLSVSQISFFIGVAVFGGMLLQWPVGGLSDRFDRITILSLLSLALAVVSIGLWVASGLWVQGIFVLVGLFGGLAFAVYPVAVARAHDKLAPAEIVPISSALILFYGAGAFMGPTASAAFMSAMGPGGLWVFIALVGAAFGTAAMLYRKDRPSQVQDQTPFVPLPRTSPEVTSLDPRFDEETP